MKCHPEHLASEFASLAGLGAREMVNASRHTFTLLSDPLQRFSKTCGRSQEVNTTRSYFALPVGQLITIFGLLSFRLRIQQRRRRLRQPRQT
jgi:hypothetical protein